MPRPTTTRAAIRSVIRRGACSCLFRRWCGSACPESSYSGGFFPSRGPRRLFWRMAEASAGKDSVTGHWELMGVVVDRPFPVFREGFSADLIGEFERRIGRRTLGNVVASGTEIIARLSAEHVGTGSPIVYASADSVFQVAAHEGVVLLEDLYRFCKVAYGLVVDGLGMSRVIARPLPVSLGHSCAHRTGVLSCGLPRRARSSTSFPVSECQSLVSGKSRICSPDAESVA